MISTISEAAVALGRLVELSILGAQHITYMQYIKRERSGDSSPC
jgi:hypothetical protein